MRLILLTTGCAFFLVACLYAPALSSPVAPAATASNAGAATALGPM
jgi:hypothetical protein